MPRSTRRPATVSAPRAVSLPATSRCTCWRRCNGRSSGPISSTIAGTPSRTTRPSCTDALSRITATTTYDTIAPERRAEHVEGAADVQGVVGRGRDHLTGGQAAPDRHPDQRAVPGEQLHGAERRAQPVVDGDPVAQHAEDRLDHGQAEHDQRPAAGGGEVAVGDALLQPAADRGGDERLGDHPDHAEDDAEAGGCATAAGRSRAGTAPGTGDPAFRGPRRGGRRTRIDRTGSGASAETDCSAARPRLGPVSRGTEQPRPRRRLRGAVRAADRPAGPRGPGLQRDRPAHDAGRGDARARARRRSSCPAGRRRSTPTGAPSVDPAMFDLGRPGVRHLLRLPGDGAGARAGRSRRPGWRSSARPR